MASNVLSRLKESKFRNACQEAQFNVSVHGFQYTRYSPIYRQVLFLST